jgi:hypothetical protein
MEVYTSCSLTFPAEVEEKPWMMKLQTAKARCSTRSRDAHVQQQDTEFSGYHSGLGRVAGNERHSSCMVLVKHHLHFMLRAGGASQLEQAGPIRMLVPVLSVLMLSPLLDLLALLLSSASVVWFRSNYACGACESTCWLEKAISCYVFCNRLDGRWPGGLATSI